MEVGTSFNEWFWNDEFWLPENVTWEDFKSTETMFIPTMKDLLFPIPIAIGLFLVRLIWERWVLVNQLVNTPAKLLIGVPAQASC